MILKLLLVIAVIATVYFMFIKKKPLKSPSRNEKKKSSDTVESNDMVECKTCGIYCEVDDSILSGSSYYCSSECLEKV